MIWTIMTVRMMRWRRGRDCRHGTKLHWEVGMMTTSWRMLVLQSTCISSVNLASPWERKGVWRSGLLDGCLRYQKIIPAPYTPVHDPRPSLVFRSNNLSLPSTAHHSSTLGHRPPLSSTIAPRTEPFYTHQHSPTNSKRINSPLRPLLVQNPPRTMRASNKRILA